MTPQPTLISLAESSPLLFFTYDQTRDVFSSTSGTDSTSSVGGGAADSAGGMADTAGGNAGSGMATDTARGGDTTRMKDSTKR